MAYWRIRDPGSFPLDFHEAMHKGPGQGKIVGRRMTLIGARGLQKDWRLFRYALRSHPAHPAAYWEPLLVHRTRIAWNAKLHTWDVLLDSRPKGLQDLVEIR